MNLESNDFQNVEQLRSHEDLYLEKEVNEELEALQTSNQASSSKTPAGIADIEVHSPSECEFVDATQIHDDDITNESNETVNDNGEEILDVVQKDIEFLKESWANLAEMEVDEDDAMSTNQTIQIRDKTASASKVRKTLVARNVDLNKSSKSADNVVPAIDDQGFEKVVTRAGKKVDKVKAAGQNSYPIRSRVGTSKPFK